MYGLDQLCLTCGTLSIFAVRKIDHFRINQYINRDINYVAPLDVEWNLPDYND